MEGQERRRSTYRTGGGGAVMGADSGSGWALVACGKERRRGNGSDSGCYWPIDRLRSEYQNQFIVVVSRHVGASCVCRPGSCRVAAACRPGTPASSLVRSGTGCWRALVSSTCDSSLADWWQQARTAVPESSRRGFDSLLVSWELWKERNRRTIDNNDRTPTQVLALIRDEVDSWIAAGYRSLALLFAAAATPQSQYCSSPSITV